MRYESTYEDDLASAVARMEASENGLADQARTYEPGTNVWYIAYKTIAPSESA